jgi:hypothetical protein
MKFRTLAFALAAVAASACATAADDSMVIRSDRAQVEAFAGSPVETVARRPLRNNERWESLGDFALLIWETRTKAWLLDLERDDEQCRDLSDEYMMHIDETANWLSSGNSHIELHNGRWCTITQIRPVDAKALRAARKSQGISSPY